MLQPISTPVRVRWWHEVSRILSVEPALMRERPSRFAPSAVVNRLGGQLGDLQVASGRVFSRRGSAPSDPGGLLATVQPHDVRG